MYSLHTVITVKNNRAIVIYDNSTVNTSITGLLPNTTYTCCVLAVTSYRESKPVCQNITTTNDKSKFDDIIKHYVPLCQIMTIIVLITPHLLLILYHGLMVFCEYGYLYSH